MDREEFGSKCIVSGREGRKFEVGTCAQERKWYRECTGIFSHVQAVQRSLAAAGSSVKYMGWSHFSDHLRLNWLCEIRDTI